MTKHRAAVVLALTLVLGASTGGLAAAQDPDRRAGAWDRSVKAEQANDLPRARAALADAYGEAPDSYEVALRLAWLSLRLKKGEAAATLYRLAARLDGAGPEATQGLADALTLTGFDAFARGDRATARARWLEALRVNPSCRCASGSRPHRPGSHRDAGSLGGLPHIVTECVGSSGHLPARAGAGD